MWLPKATRYFSLVPTYQFNISVVTLECLHHSVCVTLQFARHYPLDQKDLAPAIRPVDFGVPIPSKVDVECSARDYTPPQYLTLLFTDLGVLTPSVVSDELIQLYL
jgi:translation initiation factor eIF-2B subunit alpha